MAPKPSGADGVGLKTAILISGRGSNMAALIAAAKTPGFPAEIVLVLSNVADAPGLATAGEAGIATTAIDHKAFANRDTFDAAMTARLEESGAEFICLAGFMRILSDGFVAHWQGRMINIHPSLLPAYRGLDTHQRALDAGETEAGCTVHFVTPGLDEGPAILQATVPVLPGDTADALAARVLEQEHRIYPEALRLAAEGRVHMENGRTVLDGTPVT